MSIYFICGDPGAGKSAYGVHIAEMYAKGDKRPIYSTYAMDVPGVTVATWPEMKRLSGAVCIVDESADLFNSRSAVTKENQEQMNLFREHRKDGLTLFLIAQGFDMVDTNIRQMTRYVWHIKRMMGPDFFENETWLEQRLGVWSMARMYLAKTYVKEGQGEKKRICLSQKFFRVDALYDRFDTLAKSAGLHGQSVNAGSGLAAASVDAGRRRRRPGRLRHTPTPMPFTQQEYYNWTQPDLVGGHGATRWRGPQSRDQYDRLPEELKGLDLKGLAAEGRVG